MPEFTAVVTYEATFTFTVDAKNEAQAEEKVKSILDNITNINQLEEQEDFKIDDEDFDLEDIVEN